MFTGIIEDVARIVRVGPDSLLLETRLDSIRTGDSVAVSGICLTVSSIVQREKSWRLNFDFSPETAERTTIESLRSGSPVNIERALRADGRFGGHLMTGHVEGTGRLMTRRRAGKAHIFTFLPPGDLERYIAPKGSVGVDGISLTVAECRSGYFSVSVVPYTLEQTNLHHMVVGQLVNIEPDVLAKYVERVLPSMAEKKSVSEDFLRQNGFMK